MGVSGSGSDTDTPLSEAEKTDLRRFCGYPAIGSVASGENSWRFFQKFGAFEWRLNNLSASEYAKARVYLVQLSPLEDAVLGASNNLDTDQAAVWKRNPHEVADRVRLFDLWRKRLCGFLGVSPGPDLCDGNRIVI
ncbi:hypothetical protein AA0488_2340 [Kozakia baliensis NRIC 0488]|nr:hypothetical protein [Kozakia baliensis]GBR31646.1 hypothetical protein AA0488_2340 [Kozakia baliensis NRIC 0488]